jgi:CDP-diacylglycerol--glycerol-3-phosphate 3-phosphatidyltransferase
LKEQIKQMVRASARPAGSLAARAGISADLVTFFGILLAIVAAYGFWAGRRPVAFLGLLGSGLCDLLDGAVARARGKRGTAFGAALDSTMDRYGEGLVLGAVLLHLAARGAPLWLLILAQLSWIGSFLISYVRARSEGLGISCEVGFLERPERLILLLCLALWGDAGMPWILGLLALLSHVTFIHRLVHIRRREPRGGPAEPGAGVGPG